MLGGRFAGTHGCHARGVGFHARDASGFCLADHLGRDVLVQVQRHQVVNIGLDGAQALAVLQGCFDGSHGRDKVGLASID